MTFKQTELHSVLLLAECLLSLLLSACNGRPSLDVSLLKDKRAAVFVFLAPDCPLSQNYTLTLNNLQAQFDEASVGFYGVIAGVHYSKEEVDKFVEIYKVRFPVLLDPDMQLADFFGATATPEAFAVNARGDVIYRGAIDNWAVDLGQHRSVITGHYLMDALNSFIRSGDVPTKETRAVGCFIERNL